VCVLYCESQSTQRISLLTKIDAKINAQYRYNIGKFKEPFWKLASPVQKLVFGTVQNEMDNQGILKKRKVHGSQFTRGTIVPRSTYISITKSINEMIFSAVIKSFAIANRRLEITIGQ
jgi:hypothetical protein